MEISFNSNEEICSFQTRHLPRIQIESTRLSHFGVDIAEISSNSDGDIWRFQKDYWSRLQIESARLSPFVVDIVEISSNSDESILSFQKGERQTTATCLSYGRCQKPSRLLVSAPRQKLRCAFVIVSGKKHMTHIPTRSQRYLCVW